MQNQTNVTFHYNRHEDDQLVVETIPVMDFIARLIQHIPEKHFKQIRYFELYHKHQHISLNEMYERAMGRLPSFSSA